MKSIVVLIVIFAVIPLIRGTEYYYVNGTNYFISHPMSKNWHQAQRYCTFQGMHLLTINTPQENEIVLNIIKEFNPTSPHVHFWTSGTDAGHPKNEWYWTETGAPVLYTNWMSGPPTGADRNCILLHGGVHNFKWYDQLCNAVHNFICQDRLTVPDSLRSQRCQSDL